MRHVAGMQTEGHAISDYQLAGHRSFARRYKCAPLIVIAVDDETAVGLGYHYTEETNVVHLLPHRIIQCRRSGRRRETLIAGTDARSGWRSAALRSGT